MEYDGRDLVSDIHRGAGRAVEEGRPTTTPKGVAGPYYAVALLSEATNSPVELSLLPQPLCCLCRYLPLFVRGVCPCQVADICSGGAPDE